MSFIRPFHPPPFSTLSALNIDVSKVGIESLTLKGAEFLKICTGMEWVGGYLTADVVLKTLMVGHWRSSAGSYLTDPYIPPSPSTVL